MNVEKRARGAKTVIVHSPIRRLFMSGRSRIFVVLSTISLFALLGLAENTYSQNKEDLDVREVMQDVKKLFNLSARDVKNLRPLLNLENSNVVAIYARFSGGEPEYSNRVWREVIASRCEFLARPHADLTKRQWAALRAARARIETRIVDYLLDDYIDFLGQFLELGKWEFHDVQTLFESDKSKKLRLVEGANINDVSAVRKNVERVSTETEDRLQKLLTEDQWRAYRSLTESLVPTA